MKTPRLRLSVPALALLLLPVLLSTLAVAQGATMTSPTAPIEDSNQDNPRPRDAWFMKGRTAPSGHSAAALRYRAHQQKIQLRALRAQKYGAGMMSGSPIGLWTSIGPAPMISDAGTGQDYGLVTGRVNAVAIDPADPTGNTVYIGGAYGGLWRSTNAASGSPGNTSGVTWAPLTDDQPTLAFGAIAIQPGNATGSLSNVIVLGTGETNGAIDSYYGLGFLRSADGGQSWALIPTANGGLSLKGLGVAGLAFSTAPGHTNVVVAAVGSASVGSEDGAATNGSMRGIYTSLDAGVTWTRENPMDYGVVISANSATSVAYNAGAAKFFAAIRNHGFYSSSDGVTWTRLANQPGAGLSAGNCPTNPSSLACPLYRGEIAVVHDANPVRNEMYVWYVDNNIADQGIWRTVDGGASWTQISETGFTNCGDLAGCGASQAFFNMSLAAVPNGPNGTDLYLGAVNEFKCTLLSGATTCNSAGWLNLTHVYGCSDIAKVHPDEHAVDFKVLGSGRSLLYFGNDGGVYRALDGFTGLTTGSCGGSNQFDDLNASLGSLSQFVSFSQDVTNPVVLLGGTQDNGSPASNQVGTSLTWTNVNAGDGGYNEINPANTNEWFTANVYVSIQRCTSGIACTAGSFQANPVVSSGDLGTDVGPFYTPYILDPQSNISELLVGTCRIWRGPGTGGTFDLLSTNFETGTSAACTGTEANQVHAIAAGGPKNGATGLSNVVYATTDGTGPLGGFFGGRVFATTNAGTALMTDVTNNLANVNSYTVSGIAIDTSDPTGQTAYVTIMGFGGPHVSKTTNAGSSWTDFTGNLPDAPANTIVVDPGANPNTGIIYVGTDVGVFSSPTSIANWTEVGPAPSSGQAGFLPNVPVTKLRIFESATQKLLRASTYGRGIWQAPLILTPDFNILITNTPQTIFPSQTAVFNGKLSALNGYNSSVSLSCTAASTAPPSTCTPAPLSVTPNVAGASFSVSTGGTAGDYIFNAHAVGTDLNGTTRDGGMTLRIIDFNMATPNPGTLSANRPNTSNPTTFQVTAAGSFNQAVTLSCTGLPVGASCNFSPAATVSPISGNPVTMTLTITTNNNTPTGTSNVTVSARTANAPGAKARNLTLTVTAMPDYSLAISNPSVSKFVNETATLSGTLTALNGYATAVALSCGTGAPANCTVDPSAAIVPTPSGAPFSIIVGSPTSGSFSFRLVANGPGAATAAQSVPLTFVGAPDFALPASSGTATIPAGATATYTLAFAPSGNDPNFAADVIYSCSSTGFPNLSSCSFDPRKLAATTPAANGNVTLSIFTTAPRASLKGGNGWLYALWLGLPCFAFLTTGLLGRSPRSQNPACTLALLVFALILLQAGCGGSSAGGGGGGGPTPPPAQPGTAPGTYTVTVNASEASSTITALHSTSVTLTVQ